MIDEKGQDTSKNDTPVSTEQSGEPHVVSEEATLDLRAIRQSRGLTLQDLSASTRISPHNLKAIEEKRFDQLPEPIYARAFIDMYARALDMDGRQIRSLYETYLNTLERGEGSFERLRGLGLKKRRREVWIWLTIIAILLVIVGAFSLYRWGGGDRQEPEILSSAVQEQPRDEPPAPETDTVVAEDTTGEPQEPETDTVVAEDTTGEPQEIEHTITADIPEEEQAQAVDQAIAEETQEAAQVEQHETGDTRPVIAPEQREDTVPLDNTSVTKEEKLYALVIEASELTWLQIEKDGEPSFEIMLRQGEQISERASERFILHIGNAGGVDIRFQGKSLGPLGGHGQVIHLTLPPDE